jgi:glutamate---cysteine ligase / carboxylate-amine ligase
MLLDPFDWSVANRIDEVLAALPPTLRSHTSAETHACIVELRTAAHETACAAAAELAFLRVQLDSTLRGPLALRAATAGTHPLVTNQDVAVSTTPRYRKIGAAMRALARREPTMALHVHVAVPDGPAAARALNGIRRELPVLLALSANSPYWRAADSGFASVRTPIFSMFPRVGIPRHFGSYGDYVNAVDPLLRSCAIPDPGFLWWDARLQPPLGTVEVRIMDAQSRVADTAALAALVQCRVCRHAQDGRTADAGPDLLAENRFLAAREGMSAVLIDDRTKGRCSVRNMLDEMLEDCDAFARRLDCARELALVSALADDPGDARQRRCAATFGLGAVPALLADQFSHTAREGCGGVANLTADAARDAHPEPPSDGAAAHAR